MPQDVWPAVLEVSDEDVWGLVDAVEWKCAGQDRAQEKEHGEDA